MSRSTISIGATVIIPTLNRGSYLLDTVNDLLNQDYSPLEILIVDQSDTTDPNLQQIVEANPDVVSYHRVLFRGLPIARNFGWQMARYEIVIYVDDDIRCGEQFVSAHCLARVEPGIGLVGGRIIERNGDNDPASLGKYSRWRGVATRGFSSEHNSNVDHVPGGNFASTRALMKAVGGLDEALGIGAAVLEETELSLAVSKLGYQNLFCAAAMLDHLAAGGGGTRQKNMRTYVHALMHNRSVVIRRYSAWCQQPVALMWSLRMIAAFMFHYRAVGILPSGLTGIVKGWRTGGRSRICTDFSGGGG